MRHFIFRTTRRFVGVAIVLLLLFLPLAGIFDFLVPSAMSVYQEDAENPLSVPCVSLIPSEIPALSHTDEAFLDTLEPKLLNYEAKLLGLIPLKTVKVSVYDHIKLIPGGISFGVRFDTKGALVIGMADIEDGAGRRNPASDAGIKIRDVIVGIDGHEVNTVSEIVGAVESCGGRALVFTVMRDGDKLDIKVAPSVSDGIYRVGLWLRDSTAGIGTVTFIEPQTCLFAGLGHGIYDADTGMLMPLREGTTSKVTISSVKRGLPGTPGELGGYFTGVPDGALLINSDTGVFGLYAEVPEPLSGVEPMPIALRSEIKEGNATILCTLDDNTVSSFDVSIAIAGRGDTPTKNFIVTVTDEKLLEKTGGIVQGMSGSPIIQNGRIIGAVTHVMVNDPTHGYGIFIENMLNTMSELGTRR